jgi:type III pantothenate kinase
VLDPHKPNPGVTLLLDIGNSRIKYALNTQANEFVVKYCQHVDDIAEFGSQIDKVVLASVRSNQLTQQTIGRCQQLGIEVVEVTTQAHAFGITCAYQHYQNLGVDRWLAVLAARLHTDLPAAVIDAGTAVTCDIVVGQQHVGGWIAPGFEMMRQAVTANADRVFGDTLRPTELSLGTSTEACVNMGCLALLRGMIHEAETLLSQQGNEYHIFLCGGDIDLLSACQTSHISIKPNLVLEGLNRFI